MKALWLAGLLLAAETRTPVQAVLAAAHASLRRSDWVDCSDFIQRLYAPYVTLPRASRDQARSGRPVRSRRELKPGDLVFFSGQRVSKIVGHVGIYVGRGRFIHKPTDRPVAMDSLLRGYYGKRYLGGRRVLRAPAAVKGSGASAPKRSARPRGKPAPPRRAP